MLTDEKIQAILDKLDLEESRLQKRIVVIQKDRERYKNALSVIQELSGTTAISSGSPRSDGRITIAGAILQVSKESNGLTKSELISAIKQKYDLDVKSTTLSVTLQRLEQMKFVNDKWHYQPSQNEKAAPPSPENAANSYPENTNHGVQYDTATP